MEKGGRGLRASSLHSERLRDQAEEVCIKPPPRTLQTRSGLDSTPKGFSSVGTETDKRCDLVSTHYCQLFARLSGIAAALRAHAVDDS